MSTKIYVAGKICSGKSTLARNISTYTGFPLASFGGILRKYTTNANLPTTREALQNLGQNLIDQLGYEGFLKWIINHSSDIQWNSALVLDGLRHEAIYKRLVEMFPANILVYCICDQETQLARVMDRDKIDRCGAERIISHETERHIEELEPLAHLIFRPECAMVTFMAQLDALIAGTRR